MQEVKRNAVKDTDELMVEKMLEMTPIEKKLFFRSLELYGMSPDDISSAIDKTWEDTMQSFTDAILAAEDVETLVKDSTFDDLIHTFRWMCKHNVVKWDDITDILNDLKCAVIDRISAEQ